MPRVNGLPFPQKIVADARRDGPVLQTRTTVRQIFLGGHTLVSDPQPTWMGYSKGRWEGDTLVVETTGFNDRTWLDDVGHPHHCDAIEGDGAVPASGIRFNCSWISPSTIRRRTPNP